MTREQETKRRNNRQGAPEEDSGSRPIRCDARNVANALARAARRAMLRRLALFTPLDSAAALAFGATLALVLSPRLALIIATFALFALINARAMILNRRLGGVYTAALRIETHAPQYAGVVTAALELEAQRRPQTALERGVVEYATEGLRRDFLTRTTRERDAILFACQPSQIAPSQRAIFALSVLALAIGSLAIRINANRESTGQTIEKTNVAKEKENERFWQNEKIERPESTNALDKPERDALYAALRAKLRELERAARELMSALEDAPQYARASKILRELRTESALKEKVDALARHEGQDRANDVALLVLLRLRDNIDRREREREAIERELVQATRERTEKSLENARDRAEQLRNALELDYAAITIIEKRPGILHNDKRDDALKSLYQATLDALQARVGATQGEEPDDATRAFDQSLEIARAQTETLMQELRELANLCDERVAQYIVALNPERCEKTNVAIERVDLESVFNALRQMAREERWGALATVTRDAQDLTGLITTLGAVEYGENAQEASNRALAILLLDDARGGRDTMRVGETNVDVTTLQNEIADDAEGLFDPANEPETNDLETKLAHEQAPTPDDENQATESDEGNSRQGERAEKTQTGGNATDPNYSGGLASNDDSPPKDRVPETFDAELPKYARERLEQAQSWRPEKETLEKARLFRRKLQCYRN